MKVSEADARRWLRRWGQKFAEWLGEIAVPALSEMFHEATLTDYPSPAFSRFYRKIQNAMSIAEEEYGAKIGMECRGTAMRDEECCRMVMFLMNAKSARAQAVFHQEVCFVDEGAPCHVDDHHAPFWVHVVVQGKRAKARIMEPGEPMPSGVRVFGEDSKESNGRAETAG
jgi:hypothetical protein